MTAEPSGVIAQQYSSVTLVAPRCHSRKKKKYGAHVRKVYYSNVFTLAESRKICNFIVTLNLVSRRVPIWN